MPSRLPIAIVGIGCRLPGGIASPQQFLEFLLARGDGVTDVPADRWSVDAHYDEDPKAPGKAYVKRGAFLKQDVFQFDPEPFGISPREADRLDPQQRLLLEVAWEAFEDAGIPIDRLRGSDTAVVVGAFTQDHQSLAFGAENRRLVNAHTSVGASNTVLSNRISYTFDLKGPSFTVDTACSSSLVALHLGCEAIARGEATLAVVGGVNVMLSPATMVAMCKGQFLAPDGRSKAFDASADGYGRGEGAGLVVLKPLHLAERDGDRIYAVVVASGVNQDGKTDGMPMPNGEAQRQLAARVLGESGLSSEDVAYVEAHGTGTRAGDPVEARALGQVYGAKRKSPVRVGSVKTNVGHLEAAAGVTGLIKAVLSVRSRTILPLRSLTSPNPDIPFDDLALKLAVEAESWPSDARAVAAVNSFGYGGTNAHAIVAEWQPPARDTLPGEPSSGARLVPISASSRAALTAYAGRLSECIEPETWRAQVGMLACRRAHLPERAVLLADSAEQLREELGKLARGEQSDVAVAGRASFERRLLWVFTGMGPQWWAMGHELLRSEPAFRRGAEAADRAFASAAGWSVLEEMLRDEKASRMATNAVAQPANFVLQVGLVSLLRALGVRPAGILGHSVGELAAAWAAGCMTLETAAFLAFHRSRIQQKVAGLGTMLATGASLDRLRPLLERESAVAVAAINSPKSITVAGERAALERIGAELGEAGIFNRLMPVEVAYHSPQMEPLKDEFLTVLAGVDVRAPELPLYSTTLGRRVEDRVHDAAYWWGNARQPVQLQRALEAAIADDHGAFLEVGPHPVLGAAIKEVLADHGREGVLAHCLKRKDPESRTVRRAVAQLHVAGVALDWAAANPEQSFVELPHYAFQRERFWGESNESLQARVGRGGAQPLLQHRDAGPTPRFVSDLSRPSLAYLRDHRIQGAVVFPGAGYVEAALELSVELYGAAGEHVLEDLRFQQALVLRLDASPRLMVDVRGEDGSIGLWGSHGEEKWSECARARVLRDAAYERPAALEPERLWNELTPLENAESIHDRLAQAGLEYGIEFRRIQAIATRRNGPEGGQFLARLDAAALDGAGVCLHPALLDSAFQALLSLVDIESAVVPVNAERIRWIGGSQQPAWAYGSAALNADGSISGDLLLVDEAGQPVAEVKNLTCRALDHGARFDASQYGHLLYTDTWRETATPAATSAAGQVWAIVGRDTERRAALADAAQAIGADVQVMASTSPASLAYASKVIFCEESEPSDPTGVELCDRLRELLLSIGDASLCVVTRGAHAVEAGEEPDPAQTALVGFARVVMTEQPELGCRILDVSGEPDQAAALLLNAVDAEEEMACRGGRAYVRRLVRAADAGSASVSTAERVPEFALQLGAGGHLDSASFVARRRVAPAAGEVEVAVDWAVVDSRVASAGSEATAAAVVGRVVGLGAGVTGREIGERVHVLAPGGVASYVTVDVARVAPVVAGHAAPTATSYADFLAAWYALHDVARLRRDEIVLIHRADTPRGSACLQVARRIGARILATVDSEESAAQLGRLGVEAYSARTLDFADAIRRSTERRGVHVVLNVMTGTARQKSLQLLRAGGRFVEFAGLNAGQQLEAVAPAPAHSLCRIDLAELVAEEPERFRALADEVLAAFDDGSLRPLALPSRSAAEVVDALRAVAGGELTEVAVDLTRGDAEVRLDGSSSTLLAPDRTYLVTGGLAGFGLATGEWLVERGARHVVLASRRGKPDADAERAIQRMRRRGARVECVELDVSKPRSIDAVLSYIDAALPSLAGIFHSAMVLDDRSIRTLNRESLEYVLDVKAKGAWLLHQKTAHLKLEHFVLYSSVSALVGNPSQASYAAANAFLDGLAALRRARGLAASAVSWGALGDVGVVARNSATEVHLQSLGIKTIAAKRALALLGDRLNAGSSNFGIIDMNWNKWVRSFPETPWQRLAEVVSAEGEAAGGALEEWRSSLSQLDDDSKRARVRDSVLDAALSVLRLSPDRVDTAGPLKDYGLDSLMATELQVALEQSMGVTVSLMELLGGSSIDELSSSVLDGIDSEPAAAETLQAPPSLTVEDFLARICVQPPYFDLSDFAQDGEWLEAVALPVQPAACESGPVSCAEAARHMAILGSCAASLAAPIAGKIYYPVLRAEYPEGPTALKLDQTAPEQRVKVRARCASFDLKTSRAVAETELCDFDGKVIMTMLVEYHVIPEQQFLKMFQDKALPTALPANHNPYSAMQLLPPATKRGDVVSVELGPVDALDCMGHFVEHPALPVSIMLRDAIQLIAEGVRVARRWPAARVTVLAGNASTNSFVFAGSRATLSARRTATKAGNRESWRCEVLGDGQLAAAFELEVKVQRAAGRSEIVGLGEPEAGSSHG